MFTPFLITSELLFNGTDCEARRDAAVLVADGVIQQIGSVSDDWPLDVERVSFGAATLLPGLIDAHVHLCFDGSATPVEHLDGMAEADLLVAMTRSAERALRGGVTTVRDCGSKGDAIFRLRDAIESGKTAGPRVLAAGRPLTTPDGHCWFMGGAAAGEAEALGLVRQEVERGVDLLKVMATGGGLTPGSQPMAPQFAPATLARVVDLAHALGRPVAAHAHSRRGILDAIQAGVDTIEHGTFLMDDGPDVDQADLDVLRASGVTVVPTLTPIAWQADADGDSRLTRGRRVSPATFWRRRKRVVERFWAAGVRMIAGSDAGVPGTRHDAVTSEIALLHAVGLSPAQALLAATSGAADALGIGGSAGRIAPGMPADLLVVPGNPLVDLSMLKRPVAVFRRGQPIPLIEDEWPNGRFSL